MNKMYKTNEKSKKEKKEDEYVEPIVTLQTLDDLPDDLQKHITRQLTFKERGRMSSTSKKYHEHIQPELKYDREKEGDIGFQLNIIKYDDSDVILYLKTSNENTSGNREKLLKQLFKILLVVGLGGMVNNIEEESSKTTKMYSVLIENVQIDDTFQDKVYTFLNNNMYVNYSISTAKMRPGISVAFAVNFPKSQHGPYVFENELSKEKFWDESIGRSYVNNVLSKLI